jgi:hypothetical protein
LISTGRGLVDASKAYLARSPDPPQRIGGILFAAGTLT